MDAADVQFLRVGQGANERRIACRRTPPAASGGVELVWFIGLKSDMMSTKAEALAAWAQMHSHGLTRFDYSGHGRSSGRFEEATIGDWLEEAVAVFTRLTRGPAVLVGSSTGAHIALLMLRQLLRDDPQAAARIKGLVLIAPAWDVSELIWSELPEDARRAILTSGVYQRPSDYGEPYAITRRFIEEGRNHLLAGQSFDPGRPVAVLQGLRDADVPPAHARALVDVLSGGWVNLVEVPDGEHRMSRPQDLQVLFSLIGGMIGRACS